MTAPLGWALIGAGGAGHAHAVGAAASPDLAIQGFADIRIEASERLAAEFGGYATTDPDRVFADPAVAVVSIATTHDTHAELAIAAFAAGKHVFLEKPMALTTADCHRIVAAQRTAGAVLMLNHSFRFSGALRTVKARIARPLVSHAQCVMARADLSRWRWDPVAGGGPLWDVGVHVVDALCWLHAAPPVEVFATGGQVVHPGQLASPDLIDTTAATLRFGDDSVATLLVSDAGVNGFVSKWFFAIYGDDRSAIVTNHGQTVAFAATAAPTSAPASPAPLETVTPPAVERFPFLVEAIRTGAAPYVPASAGIVATHVVERLIAAVQTRQPQPIDIAAVLSTSTQPPS